MFSYNADQDDEVSVTEGETVDIISIKTDQDGWWKIRASGKIGLVPDNFLSAITSSGKCLVIKQALYQPLFLASTKAPEIMETDNVNII